MLNKPPLIGGKNRRVSPQEGYDYHRPKKIQRMPDYPALPYAQGPRYDADYSGRVSSQQRRRRNLPVNPAYNALYQDTDSDDSLPPQDAMPQSGFEISDNLEPSNMNYVARQSVEKRNNARWFRLLRAFHYRGQLSLSEAALLKDSTFGKVARQGSTNKNVARWAADFGMKNGVVSEAHFRLGRLAVKLLRKHEKERGIDILSRWSRLIRGLTQQQDLLHKVKTLNILRWELVVLKLL